jgi:hypothetical protein
VDGFVRVDEPVLSPTELQEARALLELLLDRAPTLPPGQVNDLGRGGGGHTIEIVRATEAEPRLRRTAAFTRCRDLARDLLGVRVAPFYDHVIHKDPGNGAATAWHQDSAYADEDAFPATAHVWLAMQDVTEASGCMQFVPGTHVGPTLPHRPLNGDASADALEVVGADTTGAVACPLPAGGVTVHHPRTLHHTGANTTEQPRLAWILHFRDADSFGSPLRRLARRLRP